MPDSDLKTWWPALWSVVIELRQARQSVLADLLVDAVRAGATSGEILDAVGVVLREHQACRSRLGDAGVVAWNAVMADVQRAYPGSKFGHWLVRFANRFARIAGRRK